MSQPNKTALSRRTIAKIGFLVFCGWVFFGIIVPVAWTSIPLFTTTKYPVLGQFGDMFGAVNSLFSAFAFAAAIVTIYHQTNELKEAGDRQLEQDRLQARQLELLQETALIQKDIRLDNRKRMLRETLMSVKKDLMALEQKVTDLAVALPSGKSISVKGTAVSDALCQVRSNILLLEVSFGQRSLPLINEMLNVARDVATWLQRSDELEVRDELHAALNDRIIKLDVPLRNLWIENLLPSTAEAPTVTKTKEDTNERA